MPDVEEAMAERLDTKGISDVPLAPKTSKRTGMMTASLDWADDDANDGMNPRDYVSSLARGLEVLRAFNRTRRKMTLSEVAAETKNTRAGARRILLTLVHEGYAVADGKLFDLTPKVLELGHSVLSSKGSWDIARPFIDHLSEELRESCSAAVLDKFDVVYVSGAQYHRILSVGISIGARFAAHATATGRVLLAAQPLEKWDAMLQHIPLTQITERTVTSRTKFRKILEVVRDMGWALVDQEMEIGLIAIAVPLRNSAGGLVGAINVSVPTVRTSAAQMESHVLPRLQRTAASISEALKV